MKVYQVYSTRPGLRTHLTMALQGAAIGEERPAPITLCGLRWRAGDRFTTGGAPPLRPDTPVGEASDCTNCRRTLRADRLSEERAARARAARQ